MTQMVAQLDIQRGLQDLLRQPGQQPTRASQLDALPASRRNELLGQRRQIRRRRTLLVLHLTDTRGHT